MDFDTVNPDEAKELIQKLQLRKAELETAEKARSNFLDFVNALENAFTIDENISILEATRLLWDFREINFDSVKKLTVPTYNYQTENGAQVLILNENFYDFLNSKDLLD